MHTSRFLALLILLTNLLSLLGISKQAATQDYWCVLTKNDQQDMLGVTTLTSGLTLANRNPSAWLGSMPLATITIPLLVFSPILLAMSSLTAQKQFDLVDKWTAEIEK